MSGKERVIYIAIITVLCLCMAMPSIKTLGTINATYSVKQVLHIETYTNGESVLMFPEWKESKSAFERDYSTNLFAIYQDGKWYAHCYTTNRVLTPYWTDNEGYDSVDDTKDAFGLSIDHQISKALYDAFSK